MSQPDQLYTLRNLFYVGNFQGAIHEANSLHRLPAALQSERQEFLYRSFVSLGQSQVVLSEVKNDPSTSMSLRAIRLLAQYTANPSDREQVIADLRTMCQSYFGGEKTFAVVAATLFIHEDSVKDALSVLANCSPCFEKEALKAQISLRMDRSDLALQSVKAIKALDDDHVLGKLSAAWVALYPGAGKPQEAAYMFEELIEKFGSTAALLNGLAVARMHMNSFEDAETSLQEALSKAPGDPDTLANLIVVSEHLQRPSEVISRYMSQLRTKSPNHPLVTALTTFESAFDRVAQSLERR